MVDRFLESRFVLGLRVGSWGRDRRSLLWIFALPPEDYRGGRLTIRCPEGIPVGEPSASGAPWLRQGRAGSVSSGSKCVVWLSRSLPALACPSSPGWRRHKWPSLAAAPGQPCGRRQAAHTCYASTSSRWVLQTYWLDCGELPMK